MESTLAEKQWYALRVRPKFERVAAFNLECKGYEQYLPMYRKGGTERVLFPRYLFVKMHLFERIPVVMSPGVISLTPTAGQAVVIPEREIATVKRVIESGLQCEPSRAVGVGQLVLVERGPLSGLTGFGLSVRGNYRVLFSVQLLQRSVSVELDQDCVSQLEDPGRQHPAFAS
jgi:transcription antitermination factor NusG